jgi:conjugal transfer mating pair stabilization protein TraG
MEGFVYGGLDHYVNAFNAIAMMMGNSVIDSLIRLVMLIGLVMVIVSAAFSLNLKETVMWFAGALLIMAVILVPRTTIIIHDRLSVGAPVAVDNVPMAVGLVFSLSSTIGDAATQLTETVFPHPEAAQYSQTGLIYGSRVLRETTMLRWPDQYFAANMDSYVVRCVMHDLHTHHYSMHDLGTAPDLFDFITVSPHGGLATQWISPDGTRETIGCVQAANQLRAGREAMADQAANRFGRVVHPDLAGPLAETTIRVNVEGAHAFIMDQSRTAADVFIQAMTINSVRDAQLSAAAESGVDISAYSMTRAEQQSRTQNFMSAEMAHKWIPLLRVVLEIIFYSMFPLMAPFFLLPKFGPQLLKKYFSGFLILQAWGPLFVILNGIMMHHIAEASRAAGYDANEGYAGVTLASMDGVAGINGDLASIAGWMTMMIPVMATMLAFGVDRLAMQSNSLLNSVSGAAQQAAADQTVGNMNLGTTAFDTHRFNQTFGNQHGTSGDVNMGHWNVVGRGGVRTAHHEDGGVYSDMSGGVSRTPFGFQNRQAWGQTARTMASDAQYQSESYSQSAAVNTAQALDAIYSRAANSSNDLSGAINVNRAEGERTVEDLSRGNSIITQAAERAGVSAQDASSASRGVTALGEAGVRGSAGFKLLGNGGGAFMTALVRGTAGAEWSEMNSQERAVFNELSQSERQELSQIFSRVSEAHRRGDISFSQAEQTSEGHSINEAFRMAHTQNEQAGRMSEVSQRFERMAEQMESSEHSYSMPSDDVFLNWMNGREGVNGRAIGSHDDVMALFHQDRAAFGNYADAFMREQVAQEAGLAPQELGIGGDMARATQIMDSGFGGMGAIEGGRDRIEGAINEGINPERIDPHWESAGYQNLPLVPDGGVSWSGVNPGDAVSTAHETGLTGSSEGPNMPEHIRSDPAGARERGGRENDDQRTGSGSPYGGWSDQELNYGIRIHELGHAGSDSWDPQHRYGDANLQELYAERERREAVNLTAGSGDAGLGGGSNPGDLIDAQAGRRSGVNWGGSGGGARQTTPADNRAPPGSVDVDDERFTLPPTMRVPRN